MRLFFRGVLIASILVLAATSVWAVKDFTARFFSIDCFSLHFHGPLSEAQKTVIADFFSSDKSLKSMTLVNLSSLVSGRFPFLKTCLFAHDASGLVHVNLYTVMPLLNIGDDFVLVHDGNLFANNLFDSKYCAQLNRLDFHGDLNGHIPQELLKTIEDIPTDFFKKYSVSCTDKATWWLQDKKQKRFFVLFNGMGIPNKRIISACNKLKGTLDARGEFTGRHASDWVADVRFDNQIILSRRIGGR